MIGKFKVMSVGGAYYSHDAVEPVLGLRFVFPVRRAHADAFIEVLTNFIAFLSTFIHESGNMLKFRFSIYFKLGAVSL